MGRPVKNNCDYFPHFTTMRNHKKVKSLRAKFGQVLGYAFWSMFVEYLTEQDGIEIEFSELEIEMFSGELGVSATEIRSMIDYCIKIELLFLTDDNFIYSDSLNELLQPVFDKRQNAKERSKTRKRHINGQYLTNNTATIGVSATEIPQIKEKESKENKIEIRKEKFKEDLKPFLEMYGKDLLNDFFLYWTEMNKDGKKMRFEMQTVFDIKRRLITWHKNSTKNNFTPTQKTATPLIPDTSEVDKARRLQAEYLNSLKQHESLIN